MTTGRSTLDMRAATTFDLSTAFGSHVRVPPLQRPLQIHTIQSWISHKSCGRKLGNGELICTQRSRRTKSIRMSYRQGSLDMGEHTPPTEVYTTGAQLEGGEIIRNSRTSDILRSAFLIAGTAIGGGFLALPNTTVGDFESNPRYLFE